MWVNTLAESAAIIYRALGTPLNSPQPQRQSTDNCLNFHTVKIEIQFFENMWQGIEYLYNLMRSVPQHSF